MHTSMSTSNLLHDRSPSDLAEQLLQRVIDSAELNDATNEFDINRMAIVFAFASGAFPVQRDVEVSNVGRQCDLVPKGGVVVRRAFTDRSSSCLSAGDGWIACIRLWRGGEVAASIAATTRQVLDQVAVGLCGWSVTPLTDDQHFVPGTFLYGSPRGPVRESRTIACDPWLSIARNYTSTARATLNALIEDTIPGEPNGRMILLHGEPGTGKTTLIRSLSGAWRGWCDTTYVLDPERLFAEPAYLFDAVLAARGDEESEPDAETEAHVSGGLRTGARWTLLVLEDCDELLRVAWVIGVGV